MKIMPVLFVGPCVSMITVVGGIADQLAAILAVCLISTVVVMAVTGVTAQLILNRKADREEQKHE